MAARTITGLSEREFVRMRLPIWLGAAMPKTICFKELIDNEIDVVNEVKQPATEAVIDISPNRLRVMDNGAGISTEPNKDDENGNTHLWLAIAKMFTSSNYEGEVDSVGANGVGSTIANFTSKKFTAINFNPSRKPYSREEQTYVRGYAFTDGLLNGVEGTDTENMESGDYVTNPIPYEEALDKYNPVFKAGYFVDAEWEPASSKNAIFTDEVDINWLINYTKLRVGEIHNGSITFNVYKNDAMDDEPTVYKWNRDPESENYVKSWEERVSDYNAAIVRGNNWTIAFSTDENMEIDSIVQGAPIKSKYKVASSIEIQGMNIKVNVPVTLYFRSKDYPKYTDQTKTEVRFPYNEVGRAFEKADHVYRHFYREAEKAYMSQIIKESDSSMFWPSLGKPEDSELIIAEGYSAISGIKAFRNPKTQACIALSGKILNCWNLEMTKAMRSEVVKQILNAVIYTPYKRIIIAVDADPDGSHICALLTALFARFTNIIDEDKLYYVHTPHYLFKKGRNLQWSDQAKDCPEGYHVTTLKGLGGMEPDQVKTFITNEETRTLQKITWGGHQSQGEAALDHAFSLGGENWIK